MSGQTWSDSQIKSLNRRRFLAASTTGAVAVAGVGRGTGKAISSVSEDPTPIEDWHDLNAIREDPGGNYVLVNDLDERTAGYQEHVSNPDKGWEPIGVSGFTGSFDGDGYEIVGLESDQEGIRDPTPTAGLFGSNEGSIRNVTITDAELTVDWRVQSVGVLVGHNDGEVVASSIRDSEITAEELAAGLVGRNLGEVTDSSVSAVDIDGWTVGGLIGQNGGQVTGSAVDNTVITGNEGVGGLFGRNLGRLENSCYNINSVQINGEQLLTIGGIYDAQYQDWLANDKELHLEDYDSLPERGEWIEITDVQGVRHALGFIDNPDLNWKLTTDLDLTGGDAGLYFPFFAGTLDGNDHTITVDLDLSTVESVGVVGQNIGEIRELTGTGNITGEDRVGGLVGHNHGEVSESSVNDADITGKSKIGGLVGECSSVIIEEDSRGRVIESSVSDVTIAGESQTGGLVGENTRLSEIIQSAVDDTEISGNSGVGGLFGRNVGEQRNSHYNLDSVQINGDQLLTHGGVYVEQYQEWLANNKELHLEDYDSLMEVDGWIELTDERDVRDALGFIDDPDLNWKLKTDLDLTGSDAGLYFPFFAGTLDGNDHTITVDLNIPVVSGVGVVGENIGKISRLTGNGTITGDNSVGGLVGRNGGKVTESSVDDADITGEDQVGGLVGHNDDGEVRQSWNTGDVSGTGSVGGLIGTNDRSEVTGSWAAGTVAGEFQVGGLVGYQWRGVTIGYWDIEATNKTEGLGSGDDDDSNITGLETDEMQGEAAVETMETLDFEDMWSIQTDPDDYPMLQERDTIEDEPTDDSDDDTTDDTEDDDNTDDGDEDITNDADQDTLDSTDDDTSADADDDGSGFGVTGAVAGIGGILYVLRERLDDDETDFA